MDNILNIESNLQKEKFTLGELIFGYIKENTRLFGVVQLDTLRLERKR
jgi:hypothetical protein